MMRAICRWLFIAAMVSPMVVFAGGLGNRLDRLFSSTDTNQVLEPDLAFSVSLKHRPDNRLSLHWQIAPGYYLYKDKFSVNSVASSVVIDQIIYPQSQIKQDPLFGATEVYYGQNQAVIMFSRQDASLDETVLEVTYQGCKEDSVCYPPIKKQWPVKLNSNTRPSELEVDSLLRTDLSEQDTITQKLKNKSLFLNLAAFFGFGVLLAFTPCIFPMIPILSGIIIGEGTHITRIRAILLSCVYVFTMALSYAVLGVIAAMFHFNLQAASQNIWALTLFSGLFVLLALSMFGVYELQLPASWQSRLSGHQNQYRGRFKGAAILGVLSAVIVGPCVAPPLAGALIYISQTGDAVLGGFALFMMGLGFGVPLLIVGATSAELLPRAGAWMKTIKNIFGVILLGVAIWFLDRVLPSSIIMMLWAALLITIAVFMGALDQLECQAVQWQKLSKGLGLVILVYGFILVVAAARGNGTLTQPFGPVLSVKQQPQLFFKDIADLEELQQNLSLARDNQQYAMLYFYADWCVACHDLERRTFSQQSVQASLSSMTLLKSDVTKNSKADKDLLKSLGLFGPPAILFFNQNAAELKAYRLIGFVNAETFTMHLNKLTAL